jgi:hypothetical protein
MKFVYFLPAIVSSAPISISKGEAAWAAASFSLFAASNIINAVNSPPRYYFHPHGYLSFDEDGINFIGARGSWGEKAGDDEVVAHLYEILKSSYELTDPTCVNNPDCDKRLKEVANEVVDKKSGVDNLIHDLLNTDDFINFGRTPAGKNAKKAAYKQMYAHFAAMPIVKLFKVLRDFILMADKGKVATSPEWDLLKYFEELKGFKAGNEYNRVETGDGNTSRIEV